MMIVARPRTNDSPDVNAPPINRDNDAHQGDADDDERTTTSDDARRRRSASCQLI